MARRCGTGTGCVDEGGPVGVTRLGASWVVGEAWADVACGVEGRRHGRGRKGAEGGDLTRLVSAGQGRFGRARLVGAGWAGEAADRGARGRVVGKTWDEAA